MTKEIYPNNPDNARNTERLANRYIPSNDGVLTQAEEIVIERLHQITIDEMNA